MLAVLAFPWHSRVNDSNFMPPSFSIDNGRRYSSVVCTFVFTNFDQHSVTV